MNNLLRYGGKWKLCLSISPPLERLTSLLSEF